MTQEGLSFPPFEEDPYVDPIETTRYFTAYELDAGLKVNDALESALNSSRNFYGLIDEEVLL